MDAEFRAWVCSPACPVWAGTEWDDPRVKIAEAAWAAAKAAERAKWKILTDDSKHIFNGGCPEHSDWNRRDPECPACNELGEWRA